MRLSQASDRDNVNQMHIERMKHEQIRIIKISFHSKNFQIVFLVLRKSLKEKKMEQFSQCWKLTHYLKKTREHVR